MFFIKVLILSFISYTAYAGDEEKLKDNILSKFTDSLGSAVENFLDGEGETKVQIDMGEDYKPEFSIVTVRPISKHHSVDATFIQLQLNEQKIKFEYETTVIDYIKPQTEHTYTIDFTLPNGILVETT